MFDAQKLLQQVLGGGGGGGAETGAENKKGVGGVSSDHVTGAAVGGLAGLLLGSKSAKKMLGPIAQFGGVAAVGTLAYQAYQTWQAKQGGQQPMIGGQAEGTVFLPSNAVQRNDMSLVVLSAMIAAAKADGHIDDAEQDKIYGRIDQDNLGAEEKAFLMDQFRKPLTIAQLAGMASTPELGVEIYTASVLAINPDKPAELVYLNSLANALKLDPALRETIETTVSAS